MGFLNDLLTTGNTITKLDKLSCTYTVMYRYWRDSLFERVMRLFIWENTGDVDPKEIEQRLILQGHCGITKIPSNKYKHSDKNSLVAMYGTLFGPTEYLDEYTNYTVRCPLYSGTRTIGKDIVVINNNALRNPTYELVHHYATLLGHTEVTIINLMINARDAGGIPIASTEKQKTSIKEYISKIFNGQPDVVTDIGNLGIQYAGTDRHTQQQLMEVMDTRKEILRSFYNDIGVRSNFTKRSNTVEAEVESDSSLLLLNLSDMLKQREKACKEINKLFGVNWKVKIAEELNYKDEGVEKLPDSKKSTAKGDKKNG